MDNKNNVSPFLHIINQYCDITGAFIKIDT
jgi:hypothetical protein